MILPTNQQNLFFPQSSYFYIHTNSIAEECLSLSFCQVVTTFAMISRFLGAPNVLNQRSFVGNFIFGKFYLIPQRVLKRFPKIASVLVLLK